MARQAKRRVGANSGRPKFKLRITPEKLLFGSVVPIFFFVWLTVRMSEIDKGTGVQHQQSKGASIMIPPKTGRLLSQNSNFGTKNKEEISIGLIIPCANQTLARESKVDVVIPWINYTDGFFESHTTPFDFGDPIRRLYEETGLRRQPFTEICYTIRSYLYHDIHDIIGNIYVVYNGYRHYPPISCGFNKLGTNHTAWPFDKVKFMPQQIFLKDVPVLNHPNMSSPRPDAVLAHVHRIPNLRPYFLFAMDDLFLLNNLDIKSFYDFENHKIISHLSGSAGSPGMMESIGVLRKYFGATNPNINKIKTYGLHTTFMLQKCRLEEVEEIFGPSWKCEGAFHLCNYKNVHFYSMMQNYQIIVGAGRDEPPGGKFSEIHIGRHSNVRSILRSKNSGGTTQWVNIQGDGISDEHIPANLDQEPLWHATLLKNREAFDDWLQRQPFYYYYNSVNITASKDEERLRASLASETYKQNHPE